MREKNAIRSRHPTRWRKKENKASMFKGAFLSNGIVRYSCATVVNVTCAQLISVSS